MTAFIINGIDRVLYAKREGETFSFSFLVGLSIEIYSDFDGVFQIAKQCKASPCHKPPLSKGGLEGL